MVVGSKPRVYPPIYFFASVLAMIGLHYLWPGGRWIWAPWRYGGILLILAGVVIAIQVSSLFRRRDTTIKPFEESSALVTDGPFRWSRNPIYLGMVTVLTGVATLLGTLTPLLLLPPFIWIIATRFIRVEEQMLEERFGESYSAYKRCVRRWFGRRALPHEPLS